MVYINDSDKGITPVTVNRLFKGSLYTIRVSMLGYNSRTINQKFYRDSTLNIELEKQPPLPTPQSPPIDLRPALPYVLGAVSSAGLWFTFQQTSIYFDNRKRDNIKLLTMAGSKSDQDKAKNSIRQNDFLGKFFYYGSYPLIASGIVVGIITRNIQSRYELYGINDIKIYCAFGENLKPSINIRRNIW